MSGKPSFRTCYTAGSAVALVVIALVWVRLGYVNDFRNVAASDREILMAISEDVMMYSTDEQGFIVRLDFERKRPRPETMRRLRELPRLRTLVLAHTGIGDAECADIGACKQLEFLAIHFTSVTTQGLEELMRSIPECGVTHTIEIGKKSQHSLAPSVEEQQ